MLFPVYFDLSHNSHQSKGIYWNCLTLSIAVRKTTHMLRKQDLKNEYD